MESDTNHPRRERVIMALGLVALLLFTANLTTFVRHRLPWRTAHHMVAPEPLTQKVESTVHIHLNRLQHRHRFEFAFEDAAMRESIDRIEARTQILRDELRREEFQVQIAPPVMDVRIR